MRVQSHENLIRQVCRLVDPSLSFPLSLMPPKGVFREAIHKYSSTPSVPTTSRMLRPKKRPCLTPYEALRRHCSPRAAFLGRETTPDTWPPSWAARPPSTATLLPECHARFVSSLLSRSRPLPCPISKLAWPALLPGCLCRLDTTAPSVKIPLSGPRPAVKGSLRCHNARWREIRSYRHAVSLPRLDRPRVRRSPRDMSRLNPVASATTHILKQATTLLLLETSFLSRREGNSSRSRMGWILSEGPFFGECHPSLPTPESQPVS
ncbi:hypothetical protein B0T14DRAFT_10350 [Immersiella caudata]|uniref:Uncharacterized protein n=1 Tax=Immersiella caudata TaxID=314043 RepID=A0AA39XD65_9PEZI|nr:hypothetical protein B0T14DRAFT_10350 [Immersiella caudata]